MEITVLLPEAPMRQEGGDAYIRQLTAALRAAGHSVAWQASPADAAGVLVVDGMAVATLPDAELHRAIGLIHHPAALAADREAAQVLERDRLPRLHRVVATSQAVADRLLAEYGVDPARLRVVAPGVPDAPRSTGSGGCAILTVGALVKRKGHATLLRALARLADLDWHLTIVGDPARDPACAAELHRQAATLPGRVSFAGILDEAALEAAWRAADLFALATEWEGHAAAVSEALRRGVPVAVTAGGAAADRVTPDCGCVCPPGDSDGLSKAMRRMIFDTTLRRDMAEAAWQAGRALPGWPTQAERFMEAIA